eukprot:m.540772 g.540772  ORF g.540772 m.540772 type:complete len:738 (-) comp22103_c1_seq1:269-2482(-)
MGFAKYARKASPLVAVVEGYSKNNFKVDVLAGLTVGVLLLPQAMAYAQLALVPPIFGLYTSVVPTILYAIFGQSHTMNLGTIALCGLLTADIIEDEIENPAEDVEGSIAIALMVAFLTGVVLFVVGVVRFGMAIQSYLSPALVSGYHTGAAFHIMMSQVKYILGVDRPVGIAGVFHLPRKLYYFAQQIPSTNGYTLMVGLSSMAIIFFFKKISSGQLAFSRRYRFGFRLFPASEASPLPIPIPAELIVVVIFEIVSSAAQLAESHGVSVIGNNEGGFIPVNNLDWSLTGPLIRNQYFEIITIAVITLSLTLSDSKTYAEETDRTISPDREITSLAIANLVSPFFGSYVAGAGISRSAIAMEVDRVSQRSTGNISGNLTQVYSIVAAIIVVCAIPVVGVISELPQAVLGAIVLMALHGMLTKQLKKCQQFWRLAKSDFIVWLVTLLVTVVVDLDWGLLVGLVVTVHTVFQRLSYSKFSVLGRVGKTTHYDYIDKGGQEYPGVKIIRLESPLFFGSKDRFYEHVCREVAADAAAKKNSVDYHTLVVDASSMNFLDVAGAHKLVTLKRFLERNYKARLLVACGNEVVNDVLDKSDIETTDVEERVLFDTVNAAVLYGADRGIFIPPTSHLRVPAMALLDRYRSLPSIQPRTHPTVRTGSIVHDVDASTAPLLGTEMKHDDTSDLVDDLVLSYGSNTAGSPSRARDDVNVRTPVVRVEESPATSVASVTNPLYSGDLRTDL